MELIRQNYIDNFKDDASNSPPSSSYVSSTVGAPQLNPRVGYEYQVEIPSIINQLERLKLLMNPAESEFGQNNSLSFAIGLPVPVTQILQEVENSGHERREYHGDDGEELKPITFQSVMIGDSNSGQLGKNKTYALVPGTSSNSWSDTDAKTFLLGLYIFGKNFIQIRRFLENKEMGEILAFYYGKFYKSDEYRRWSDCRKIKGRNSMIGKKFFTGRRQHVLLSRLIPNVLEESKDILRQVSKSYTEGRTSLEEYISSLKSMVGLGVLVEAVGIGKEKEDLTSLAVEPRKKKRVFPAQSSEAWSSLGPSGIINFLTGEFRLSKAKSNDLFWEAVWPRLLARGWHSEQPANHGYVSSKDYLVFLIPGVKKFSRRKLVKGDQYFDSVSDILSKVAAEPNLLDTEEGAKVGSCDDEEPERGSSKDDQSDYHRQRYLKPQASTYNTDHIKFMVIDTSLVHGGKSSELREFKPAPVNLVGKVEVNAAADIACKGAKHMKNVHHNKDMSGNIDQKLTDTTSMLCEGKLLKMRELKYLSVEVDDASKMTGLLREIKGSSRDDSPSVVEANMLIHDNKNISNTDDKYNAKKVVGSLKNQQTSNDNQLKRTIKHQFSRRATPGHSNHAVLPIKRRTLTAYANAETSQVVEDSSRGLGSEKVASSRENVGDPVSCQRNASLIPSSTEKSVEENKEKCILNEICQGSEGTNVSHDKVEKCESQSPVTFNIPQVPSKSENGEIMAMMAEDGQSLKAVVEQQTNVNNSRRQSTRNRPLTVRALESLANEFLHGPKRQKRKHIETHQDAFSVCRRARTKGKKMVHSDSSESSDHGTAVLIEEKYLNGDCTVI